MNSPNPVANPPAEQQGIADFANARLAAAILLSCFAAVALTNGKLSPQEAVIRWLVFSICGGLLVNSAIGLKIWQLTWRALVIALTLCVAIVAVNVLLNPTALAHLSSAVLNISGQPVPISQLGIWLVAMIIGAIFVLTALALVVAAMARPVVVWALRLVPNISADQVLDWEKTLNAIAVLLAAGWTLLKAMGGV